MKDKLKSTLAYLHHLIAKLPMPKTTRQTLLDVTADSALAYERLVYNGGLIDGATQLRGLYAR